MLWVKVSYWKKEGPWSWKTCLKKTKKRTLIFKRHFYKHQLVFYDNEGPSMRGAFSALRPCNVIWSKKVPFAQSRLGRHSNLISSKMMTRKFHAPSSTANHHKCPLYHTLPNGGSNFQSDFFAILIADSDSWQKTAWRNCLSFSNIMKGSWSNKPKTKK